MAGLPHCECGLAAQHYRFTRSDDLIEQGRGEISPVIRSPGWLGSGRARNRNLVWNNSGPSRAGGTGKLDGK